MDSEFDQTRGKNRMQMYTIVAIIAIIATAIVFFVLNSQKVETVDEIIEEERIETPPTEATPTKSNSGSSRFCWDGVCGLDETYANCPEECVETCGDGIVQDEENWQNCRYDLMYTCGDGVCDEWEHFQYCNDCEPCIVGNNDYSGIDKCPPNPRWVD